MINLPSKGFGGEGGGWQNSPEVSHGQGSIESSNLANFIGEGHEEVLGSSPTETKAMKVC